MAKTKLVVVGNGMAGARAVEEVIARGGDRFDIVMFGAEPYGNYNRILLSGLLSGAQAAAEIFIHPLEWYARNNVRLHAGVAVDEIDRAARVVCGQGIREPYDKLLIATGSRAFIPPMAGVNGTDGRIKPGVFGFRTIDDCDAIIAKAKGSRRAAVIGGGLLGLEAARGLLNHGCEVHVIHLAGHLMEMQLDPVGGAILKSTMEAMGVKVHLGKLTSAVLGDDEVAGLAFKDGSSLDCDMVVVAAGIRPNAELAARSGLEVKRAIVVDDRMCTMSDPDVYAVGECAEHRGRVYGLVAPLWEQAKVFADGITGHNSQAAYAGSRLATKLKVMGVELASMGITEAADERDEVIAYTEAKKGTYKKLIVRDGRLVGGILMGDVSKAAYLMQCFDRDAPLPDERASLLFDFAGPTRKLAPEEMPADMQVCNCNGVSKGTIAGTFAGGVREAAAVMNATRAGKGCGSCKALVTEIVAWLASSGAQEPSEVVAASAPSSPPSDVPPSAPIVSGARVAPKAAALVLGPRIAVVGAPEDGRTGETCLSLSALPEPVGLAMRTCVGTRECRFGQGDSMALAAAIERRCGDGRRDRLTLATAGCPRNCPEAQTSDVGAVAVGDGNWEVYVGGVGGPAPRKSHILCTVAGDEETLRAVERFVALYRRDAGREETAAAFVARLGISRLRAEVDGESGEEVGDAIEAAAVELTATARRGSARPQAPAPGG